MDLYCKGTVVVTKHEAFFPKGTHMLTVEEWIDARLNEGYEVTSDVRADGITACVATLPAGTARA